jgi:hypothetical protein
MLSMVQGWAVEQHQRDKERTFNGNLVLGPEQLALLRQGFDAAWEEVGPHYSTTLSSVEVGRLRLANAVFAVYRQGAIDPAAIKAGAIQLLRAWEPGSSPILALANGKDERGPKHMGSGS